MDVYHVRFSKEEDPRGPYDMDALQTLAETGRLTRGALVFDPATRQWQPLDALPDLRDSLFQTKKALSLRKTEPVPPVQDTERQTPPSIEQMLTRESMNPEVARRLQEKQRMERLAALSIPMLSLLLGLSALSLLGLPIGEVVTQWLRTGRFDPAPVLRPAPLVGLVDTGLALLLFLRAIPGRWLLVARAIPGSALLASLPLAQSASTMPLSLLVSASAIAFGTGVFLLSVFPKARVIYPAACLASAGLFLPLASTLTGLWKFVP